jgi:hypothetical protein
MNVVTVTAIMDAKPCRGYTRERVAELVGEGMTPRQIAGLDIPAKDRLWCLISLAMDDRQRRMLACDCAERALIRERDAGSEPDPRSWEAVRVARLHADGRATGEELAPARTAARHATLAAARHATLAAARHYAAGYAVARHDAARHDAAGYAAWAATRYAAVDAAVDATLYVAADATLYAALYAAADATLYAARYAAENAEREWQLAHALELIEEVS